jgi:predicted small lipoprotein YifL
MGGSPGLAKAAVIGLIAVLALAGCGRKGPLEAPPNAAIRKEIPVDPAKASGNQGDEARRTAPQKRTPLDVLIGK